GSGQHSSGPVRRQAGRVGGPAPVRPGGGAGRPGGPGGEPAAAVRRAPPGGRIDTAYGFVLLPPENNHGYSGVLKNAMDHTFVEWRRKPVAFVGWGNVGGARAVEQLRLVTVEFEMAPLRHAVHILPDQMRASQASVPF